MNTPNLQFIKKGLAYKILKFLHDHKSEEVWSSKLSRKFEMSEPNVMLVIRQLEKCDLIRKEKSKFSKRIGTLKLTDKGNAVLENLDKIDSIVAA